MKKIICGLLSIMIMIGMLSPVQVFAEDKNTWKTVRVSTGINKALYLDEKGEPVGYCSEYIQQIAKINHWKLEYVEDSWTNSVQNLYDGKIDLLFPTQMTEERKGKMGFSNSIGGYQPIGLFANADSTYCYDDYESFNGARIALSAGTSNEESIKSYAKENHFSYKPVYMNTTSEKMEALQNGDVDMIVFSTLNDVENGKVVAMLDYLPFYYCTNIDNTELLKELNYAMNQMLLRNPTLVQEVFYDFMNKNISFAYTKEEEEAIAKKGKVVVGVYKNTAPLFDVKKDGTYAGIYVDLIKKIQELSGLDIEIKPLDRKEYAFDYLDQGNIDYVLGSSDQALKYSKEKEYIQSEGIMDYYTIAITKSNVNLNIEGNLVFALTTGRRYWEPMIQRECPNAKIKYYQNSKDCLVAVQNTEADVTLLNTWEYNYQSKNTRFQNLIEWENSRTLSQAVFVSLVGDNEIIRSVLDKSIEQISNAEKEKIITANLNISYEDYSIIDRLYQIKYGIVIFCIVIIFLIVAFSIFIIMKKRTMCVLEESNAQLTRANESKDTFLSRMSHELRTPLNAIDGYTSVIEQNIDATNLEIKEFKSNLESIRRAVKYQLAIIGDLLDIQKIESGKVEIQKTEVYSEEYMESVVKMIQPEANEKKIHFSYEKKNAFSEIYDMDGVRFQQVLLNILHNAIKFTPEGGSVRMSSEVIDHDSKTDTLKFVISDTGIGMSEDFQKNYLFKRFAQEYSGSTSPYEGCGTGLALSKDIMHLMGGCITCESTQGVGSSFTVILTAQHVDKKRKRRQREIPDYDLSGIRVLLCEDNPMNQDIESKILKRMRCEVEVAEDGVIGLEKFSNSELKYYSIILMDIRMPNMDGWECTKQIRELAREDAKSIPILAVSANAFEEDIKHSLDAGMNEHLSKPVDINLLYEKITQYCKEK